MPKPLAPLTHIVPRSLRAALPLAVLALTAGCLDRPVSPAQPTTTNLFIHSLPNHVVDKADLLFMIDNSMSMADKQEILAKAVPVLVKRLATPRCLDAQGNPNGTVSDELGKCANGRPEFAAVKDIHVGVVTSSLGSHGGTECQPAADDATTGRTPDDHAELLPTANPAVRGSIDSWNDSGFLAWDPTQKDTPPGDGDLDHFGTTFGSYVQKAGENGCGYEAQLESWYRFLIDPEPPVSVTSVAGPDNVVVNQLGPVNQVVLDQRKAFLRPDSLLAIVMLTDENDCSVIDDDGSQGWLVTELVTPGTNNKFYLPRASAACAQNPDDPCCHSCAAEAPSGCTPNASDAECSKSSIYLQPSEDSNNLRCYDQKRRFGLDLLYPLQRYIDGLTKSTVRDRSNQEVPNPIFEAPTGEPPRPTDLVLLAGIVGVPWQDIATSDSLNGDGLTYLTAAELDKAGRWPMILGDDTTPPSDPLMQESIAPRSGSNPVLNAPLAPPTAATLANPINGHESNIVGKDDLQYACIFPLPTPRQCDTANGDACDCTADDQPYERPLCDYPNGPNTDGVQRYAKAYPGLRELGVLQGVKDNGIVASICAKHTVPAAGLAEEADGSYGYNPAVSAMGDIIRQRLARECLPRPLTVQTDPTAPDF
ncbi:MAG TPA: hypothetical protein VMI54_01555, partial [Polyangiaceae bacterium]|nr:hypothetical protein [Polyangiaceae bacterium]